MKIIIFCLTVLAVSLPVYSDVLPVQNLLTYFSANCKGQGEYTRTAISESAHLIETLKAIQSDNDCKTVSGSVAQLGLLQSQLTRLQDTSETQQQIAEYNAKEQELLIQISKSSSPDSILQMNQLLINIQMERAAMYSKEKHQSEMNLMNKGQVLGEVIQLANTAFTQINGNQTCLQKHPNVLNTATTLMASIGATATVVNPALGLGLSAGATLLGQTVESVRGYRNSREIRRIADNTIAMEAYRCALEVMSQRWCQMREAEEFLAFKDDRTVPNNNNLENALRLADREIPVVIEWLEKIRNGVTPTSTADSQRQNSVRERESYINIKEASGLGLIEETRKIYEAEDNVNEQWKIIKGLVKSLVPNEVDGWRNPLHDAVGSRDFAFFYLIGVDEKEPSIRTQQGTFHSLDTWPKYNGFTVDLKTVLTQFKTMISTARKRVNQELSTVLQPNPLQTLTSAYDKTGNRWKIKPVVAFETLIAFLKANPPVKEDELPFRKLHFDTLKRLEEIVDTIENAVILHDFADASSIEAIYNSAQLRYGIVVMEARLDMMVRIAVLKFIENSSPEDRVIVTQLLASERFTDTILSATGKDTIDTLRDIQNAKPITMSNLDAFMDIFGFNINRQLSKLKWDEENNKGTIAQEYRNKRTQICFHLLAVPHIDKYIQRDFCQGLQIKAYEKGGPDSIVIQRDTFDLDFDERACIHKEFIEKSKIYKTWRIK